MSDSDDDQDLTLQDLLDILPQLVNAAVRASNEKPPLPQHGLVSLKTGVVVAASDVSAQVQLDDEPDQNPVSVQLATLADTGDRVIVFTRAGGGAYAIGNGQATDAVNTVVQSAGGQFWQFLTGGSPELLPASPATDTMEDFFIRMPIDAGGGTGPFTQFEMFDDGGGVGSAFTIFDSGGDMLWQMSRDWAQGVNRKYSLNVRGDFSGGDDYDIAISNPGHAQFANEFGWVRSHEAGWIIDCTGSGTNPGEGFILVDGDQDFGDVQILAYTPGGTHYQASIDVIAQTSKTAGWIEFRGDYMIFENRSTFVMGIAPSAELFASDFSIGFDDTPGASAILFKGKDSAGTVVTGSVPLV